MESKNDLDIDIKGMKLINAYLQELFISSPNNTFDKNLEIAKKQSLIAIEVILSDCWLVSSQYEFWGKVKEFIIKYDNLTYSNKFLK